MKSLIFAAKLIFKAQSQKVKSEFTRSKRIVTERILNVFKEIVPA